MKTEKIKNYNQKTLAILGAITIIIGIIFILTTIKETEDIGDNLEVFAFKRSDNKDLKYYDCETTIIRDTIADSSKVKFNEHKNNVQDSLTILKTKLIGEKGNKEKRKRLAERIDMLKAALHNLKALESSTFTFKLNELHAKATMGNLTYDTSDKTISINYKRGNTYNFIHEATHAYQFQIGDIAFTKYDSIPTAGDLPDEVWAYKAQYAYDPDSVIKITSIGSSSIGGFEDIDTVWVKNIQIKDHKKDSIYDPYKKITKNNIKINTTLGELRMIYLNMNDNYDTIKLKNLQKKPRIIKEYIVNNPNRKNTTLGELRVIDTIIDFDTIIRLKNIPGIIIGDSLLLNVN